MPSSSRSTAATSTSSSLGHRHGRGRSRCSRPCPEVMHTKKRPDRVVGALLASCSVLEGVLDVLGGVLEIGLRLVGLALALEFVVVGRSADGLLGLALGILGG